MNDGLSGVGGGGGRGTCVSNEASFSVWKTILLDTFLTSCTRLAQGTILTGTVLRGTVAVGNEVELPAQGIIRKVKSMQMFRKPVTSASMGDRVGMCVTSLDAKAIERGVSCGPIHACRHFAACVFNFF